MDRGAWGAAVYGIAQSRARLKHLSRTNNRASRWLRGKEFSCQCKRGKRYRCDPQVGKIPWRRRRQPTPVLLPGESHEQRRPGGHRVGHDWACAHNTAKQLYFNKLFTSSVASLDIQNKGEVFFCFLFFFLTRGKTEGPSQSFSITKSQL